MLSVSFSLSTRRPKDTRDNILATKEFTVSIVSEAFAEAANATAVESPADTDEWLISGLTKEKSTLVKPPFVRESAAAMECELYSAQDIGLAGCAEPTTTVVLGRIRKVHVWESVLNADGETIDPGKLRAISRLGGLGYGRLVEGFQLERIGWKATLYCILYILLLHTLLPNPALCVPPAPLMADSESHVSRAEQRMLAVAKLKRAASLPRMKDGRRPPMHAEFVSEGEKVASEDDKPTVEETNLKVEATTPEPIPSQEDVTQPLKPPPSSPSPLTLPQPPLPIKPAETEVDADTELEPEDRPTSPSVTAKKRRSRSRSRSRTSKDMRGRIRDTQSPAPHVAGDSSQDEYHPQQIPPPIMVPMIPQLAAPVPPPFQMFQQQGRFLRSPTPLMPDMSMFYPGTSPPTPLPTLEDWQSHLCRSNSSSATVANRRDTMAKLTGGKGTYDASPSPTPPPLAGRLNRNNTVSGGERFAARQNLLNRLEKRIGKEQDTDAASGADDKGAASGSQAKKRRRRSKRNSAVTGTAPSASDPDSNSADGSTPAVPITPLPMLPMFHEQYIALRAASTTPNQFSSSGSHSRERTTNGTPPAPPIPSKAVPEEEIQRLENARRRSVIIEDPDDDEPAGSVARVQPSTPQRSFSRLDHLRATQTPDLPSNGSSDSGGAGVGVPIVLTSRAPSRVEPYPSSPFTTPLKENPLSDGDGEDDQVLYRPSATLRPRTPFENALNTDNFDRVISWDAVELPVFQADPDDMDEEELEETGVLSHPGEGLEVEVHEAADDPEEEEPSVVSGNDFSQDSSDNDVSPRVSASSKSIIVESEIAPDNGHAYIPPSPSSTALLSQVPFSDRSVSPQSYPARLSVASRIQAIGDRSPLAADFPEWDERHDSPKRGENPSTWEKMKNIVRTGSSAGRRSRTNSIVTRDRRDNVDSSASRESGASLVTDKGDPLANQGQPHAPPLMQTPSASAEILSLSPHAPPRATVSPIPPATSADMSRYQNSKLAPFPGLIKLEEARRLKGATPTPGTDGSLRSNGSEDTHSPLNDSNQSFNTPVQSPEPRERKLSHQNSDSRLAGKRTEPPSPAPQADYFTVPSAPQNGNGNPSKLPMTLPGVKQWLSKHSKKRTPSAPPTPGSVPSSPAPTPSSITFAPSTSTSSATITNKKPSISDIFAKKGAEVGADWENVSTPSTTSQDGQHTIKASPRGINGSAYLNGVVEPNRAEANATPRLPNAVSLGGRNPSKESYKVHDDSSPSRFTTPDPSGASDYPAPTASEASSTSSSQLSHGPQAAAVFERLEDNLSRNSKNSHLSILVEDPPRKLILSSPVLQVVNPNTVKERFLFLFNDILIITKPLNMDQEGLMDTYKVSLPDRKYAVKNVVLLRNLRFTPDRTEAKVANHLNPRNPLLRTFVNEFAQDPEQALTSLFSKSSIANTPALVGQILFRTLELDRTRLGDYLSRRTSKPVLKSYLDSFGFAGFRIDVALRVFLHSIHFSESPGSLEHLLDSFASRWYEVNATFVPYDKDMAVRLVRTLVQLNEVLHGGIADEPGPTNHHQRNVTTKDFQDAFRRYDPRHLLSDELLAELYRSIFHERLSQASSPRLGLSPIPITIKRPLPTRLTYKSQSEPVVLRLPQPDPLLSIELYGQDLVFDPPVLHFNKSSEASFRVMGTFLGSKTVIMCRSGPNATRYSGLPQSHTIVVERAFMRNTFQLAFMDQEKQKKRYMFSVDDPIIRNEWATSLKRQIDAVTSAANSPVNAPLSGSPKFLKAVDHVSFKVLRDTLLGITKPAALMGSTNGSFGGGLPGAAFPMHFKSKSFGSSCYGKQGSVGGVLEFGQRSLNTSQDSSSRNDYSTQDTRESSPMFEGVLWTSRELEMHCQQNSCIPHALSVLQVATQEPHVAS